MRKKVKDKVSLRPDGPLGEVLPRFAESKVTWNVLNYTW